MVSGKDQAVAMVFGKHTYGEGSPRPQAYFNKLDTGAQSGVIALLPCVESDWPDNSTITQTLIVVPGTPDDVP